MADEGVEFQRSTGHLDPSTSQASNSRNLEKVLVLRFSGSRLLQKPKTVGEEHTEEGREGKRQSAYLKTLNQEIVIHEFHGGHYPLSSVTRTCEEEHILLEYRGDDRLYLPTEQIDTIRPYTGRFPLA